VISTLAEQNIVNQSKSASLPRYVLISPARNEAAFIEQTIQSVIAQTHLPLRWVIVSDGSTDGTDDIVKKYQADHAWIELVRMPERTERHFAGKVDAFNAGRAKLANLDYDVIGNLDTDVSFDADYFAFLLRKFVENPRLGVAGTPFREGSFQYDYRFTSIEHVSGQIQMFRRECFEEIGGYVPIKSGGVDLIPVITARMKGWQTRTFPEMVYLHHRKMSSANHSSLGIAYNGGRTDYTHGCDPVWELFRSVYQMTHPPVILGGVFCLAGYVWAMVTRTERVVTAELVQFRKIEQRRRLREFIKGSMSAGHSGIAKSRQSAN
jgi:poly-beta-1,6-N-acetyl-D-glucosamine synthase